MKKLFLLLLLTSCATKVVSPKAQIEEKLRFQPEIQVALLAGEKPYKKFDSKILLVEEENPNDQRIKRIKPLMDKGYCPVAKVAFDFEKPESRYNAMIGANSVPFKRGKLTNEELKEIAKKVNSEMVVAASYDQIKGRHWVLRKQKYKDYSSYHETHNPEALQEKMDIRFENESYSGNESTRYEIFFLNKREDIFVKTDCDFYNSVL